MENEKIFCPVDGNYYDRYIKDEETGLNYEMETENYTYIPMLSLTEDEEEQELLKNPIRFYGSEWQKWMELNYPEKLVSLKIRGRWELIPRLVDKEAEELADILDKNYREKFPRPETTFMETATWEKMRLTSIRQTVMAEVVCKLRT